MGGVERQTCPSLVFLSVSFLSPLGPGTLSLAAGCVHRFHTTVTFSATECRQSMATTRL